MKHLIPTIFLLSLVCISANFSQAQNIRKTKGIVIEKHEDDGHEFPLPGSNVFWVGLESKGVATDADGMFSIANPDSFPAQLVISFIGKVNDTLLLKEATKKRLTIALKENNVLEAVTVEAEQDATSVSLFSDINKELITTKELKKAACCSLAESFETTATIDVKFDDAVTGTKKIQMLGLDGVYAQILNENIPMIGGLSSGIGLGAIPGTWIESISISKGAGSVVNGYESITGQINIDLIKPDNADQAFYNAYFNSRGNVQVNMHLGHKFGKQKKWSSLMFLHMGDLSASNDNNNDSLLDMPINRKYSLFNRWKYESAFYHSQFGIKYLNDRRTGGQLGFSIPEPTDTIPPLYGIGINVEEVEVFSKNGFIFPKHPFQSIGLQISGKMHQQNAFYGYGIKNYKGSENRLYANLIYQIDKKDTTNSTFKLGASYVFDDFDETFIDTSFKRRESVPGFFTEHTLHLDKATLVTGARLDHHNLYGFYFLPRLHFKYNPSPKSTIRFSGGKGFRTANFFVENARALASSRKIVFLETLMPEVATNFGTSVTQKFRFLNKPASLNVDYYHTLFTSQVIADYDTDVTKVLVYNLTGESYSNSFQVDFDFELAKNLDVKMAYKYYDVKITYDSVLMSRPLIPTNRALLNLSYNTKNEKWKFNVTGKYFGTSRIPSTAALPVDYRLETKSSPYHMYNLQVTRIFKNTEWYGGIENISNYLQENPIIDASNPFGSYFDASLIWGPLAGRMFFIGMRLNIE